MPWRATDLMSQVTHITSNTDAPLTMSSKEIAKLTKKEHKHVVRDIRAMLAEIGDGPDLDHVRIDKDSRGYTSQINLSRELTQTLVTGYSVPLRLAVIRRLNELEAQVAKPASVDLTDAASLRGLLLGYTEQVMQLEHKVGVQAEKIEQDKPKVEFHDAVVVAENTHTMKQAADILGIGRNKLLKYLRQHDILIEGGKNHNLPYQPHKDAGRFVVGEEPYNHPHTGKIMLGYVVGITGKGLVWIREHMAKNRGKKAA